MKPDVDLLGVSIKTFGVVFALAFLACGALVARRRMRNVGRASRSGPRRGLRIECSWARWERRRVHRFALCFDDLAAPH